MNVAEVLEGRFELRAVLGEGGMGQVFKAWDRDLDRFVAVKTLLSQFISDPAAAQDMKREVKLAQRLTHEGIVAVYDYRVHERTPYIVMELVEGQDLLHVIWAQPGNRLEAGAFHALAEPILAGVGYAHRQGVIHRDLKPENIMVLPGGHIKLMDFGIAAAVQANYTRMTGRTSSLSVAYASPEQINGEHPAPSMDIYSLGCVFYAMLCGHPPFYQGEILYQQMNREPPPLEGVSAELNAAVLGCLVKDPGRRLRSVEEVRAALAGHRTVRIPRAAAPAAAMATPASARPVPPASASPPTGGRAVLPVPLAPTGADPAVPPQQAVSGPGLAAWLLAGGVATILVAIFWALQTGRGASGTATSLPPTLQATPPTARPGERRTFADGEYVWVPAGPFMMGCTPGDSECHSDEKPRHQVTLTRGYWMSRTETTVGQYRRAGKSASSRYLSQTDDHPAVNVSWYEADAYCRSVGGRLPTEAEWEQAARGGREDWRYPWGATISHENANYWGTGGRDRWANTSPVGSFASNEYGLVDMSGNVWEWCADSPRTYGSAATDPSGGAGSFRALRGGSWYLSPWSLRVSVRDDGAPGHRNDDRGFRCVRDASP